MKKFEYDSLIKPSIERLNELGKDGWEVVGIMEWEGKMLVLMKRELSD